MFRGNYSTDGMFLALLNSGFDSVGPCMSSQGDRTEVYTIVTGVETVNKEV